MPLELIRGLEWPLVDSGWEPCSRPRDCFWTKPHPFNEPTLKMGSIHFDFQDSKTVTSSSVGTIMRMPNERRFFGPSSESSNRVSGQ